MFKEKVSRIFIKGMNKTPCVALFEKNIWVDTKEEAVVSITAASFYRLWINGNFVMYGPARSAHGYLRVDEIPVSDLLVTGENLISIEVVTYGRVFGDYSNDTILRPGVLACEIRAGGEVLATSDLSWKGYIVPGREMMAEKISHCRQMAEIYYQDRANEPAEIEITEDEDVFIPRGMSLPDNRIAPIWNLVEYGGLKEDPDVKPVDMPFVRENQEYYDKLQERPFKEYLCTAETSAAGRADFIPGGWECDPRQGDMFLNFDIGRSELGFIGCTLESENGGIVDIIHLESNGIAGEKSEIANCVARIHLQKGKEYKFLSMEPALGRYFKFYLRGTGKIRITDAYIRTYYFPQYAKGGFQCSDDDINRLYEAARRTLLLNTLDIFMDCPERERGGWLCDSLWTARAAAMMLGDTDVERSFIENFLMTKNMWKGLFPEVYPANKGNYDCFTGITTWSFWLMAELCEYVQRSGDMEFALKYKDRIEQFVEGALSFKGQSGLLENLPYLFVDWSLSNSNEYNQPISSVANSLLGYALRELGKLYQRQDWIEEGTGLWDILREVLLSKDPSTYSDKRAFPDSLSYENGRFTKKPYYSETCQYVLFWTGIFNGYEDRIPNIIESAVKMMGPAPEFAPSPDIGAAQIFIGLCIRLDMLARLEEYQTLVKDIKAIFYPQLKEGPGTLWESKEIWGSSRCHGFTSHTGVHLMRDILGIGIPEEISSKVIIAPHPCGLRWAKGTVPTRSGVISVAWRADYKNCILYIRVSAPENMNVELRSPKGFELKIE